jgi:hypothetical protein
MPFRIPQRGQVEDVLEALAVRLEHDRELRVAPRDLEETLGLQPLLPERGPLARSAARDEEGARGVLAEARSEQGGLPELREDEVVDLARVEQEVGERGRCVGVREVESDSVVRPQRLRVDVERVPEPGRERHRPGGVHPAAERREDAHAPVADLVAEALDDDRPVRWHDAGRRLLLPEERDEVPRGTLVQRVVTRQPLRGCVVVEGYELPGRCADPRPELRRAADALSLPERRDPRRSGSRRDEHPVARDVLDPPRRGTEHERLALPGLVHHLLVELAHPAAAVDEEDAEEAAVGDRAGVRHREPACSGASAHDAGRAVPDDPRAELGELV